MSLTIKRKVRGAKRKSQIMLKNIKAWTKEFPEIDFEYGYSHIHMPIVPIFIDSTKTPSSVRRLFLQTLIDRVIYLIHNKPSLDLSVRVVAAINLSNLSESQIVVFWGDKHYNGFFDRSDQFQNWIPLPPKRNIVKEWQLRIPENLNIKGFKEEIADENSKSINELWFIGELSEKV